MDKPICSICDKPIDEGEGQTVTGSSTEGVEHLSGHVERTSEMSFDVTFHWECMMGRKVSLPGGLVVYIAKNEEKTTKH